MARVEAVVNGNVRVPVKDRYEVWKKFLEKWPASRLSDLTLDDYTSYGEPYQSFCNWLEVRSGILGSIWGGSAYKFGVFKKKPDDPIIKDKLRDGAGDYKWYKRYGTSAEKALESVKAILVQVASASASGDLKKIDDIKFGHAVTWKVAFIYQDMMHPSIVPIYNKAMLCKLTQMPNKTPTSELHAKLLSEKPQGQDIFDYYEELLKKLPQNSEKNAAEDDAPESNEGLDNMEDAVNLRNLSKEHLTSFIDSLAQVPLQYDEPFVRRFFAAMQAKRFVVLTGLSGSGKTQLALQFCKEFAPGRHAIVPVGADWTNNEKMLGYPDAMTKGRYVKPETGVLDLVLKAAEDPDNSYVLILDEMNLSHVERYFADFLSAMESRGELKLHGRTGELLDGVPATVKMPENLWVIGTMNVDETTYMFSPKVLDRAQVLEFRVKAAEMAKFLQGKQEDAAEALNGFFPELAKVGAEFGYRTAGEFCSFVEKAAALGSPIEEAVDAAIMQKLLPKLHGSRRQLEKPLEALWKLCLKKDSAASVETLAKVEGEIDTFPYTTNCIYPISAEKIARLFKNAKDNGFASYAEA